MKTDIFNTDRKYDIIYADPPWKYGDSNCQGAAEKQYNTMSIEELKNLPVEKLAAKDCVLFLWATYPMIKEALELIEAWGFKYKTIGFQWLKLNHNMQGFFFGLGRWTRGNTEPCLIATKGKPKRKSAKVSQLLIAPLTTHSTKPPETRNRIMELCGEGTAIELFARQQVEGWDCWGNEV